MKEPLTCYLIDDQTPNHVIFTKYIEQVPYLTLLGHSLDPFEGLDRVQALQPDVLFLDIEMPGMTGLQLLNALPPPHPAVVMVTASPQFAAVTYEIDSVVHYLHKPVGFDKFMDAVRRVTKRLGFETDPNAPAPTRPPVQPPPPVDPREKVPYFLLKEDKKIHRVAPQDILYAEGMKDYIKFHLPKQVLVIHMTMSRLEEMLAPAHFLRINRSFIVRLGAIKEIDGNQITLIDGDKLSIGVTYRDGVMAVLKKYMLG